MPGKFASSTLMVADLHRRMDVEHVPDHLRVPGPVVFGVRRGVNADEAAARPDVALERGLLLVVEDVAGGAEEDHRLVLLELRVVEHARGVLGPEHVEVVQLAETTDRRDAFVDRFVVPAGGLREQQHAELFRVGGARGEQAEKGEQEKAVVFDHGPLDERLFARRDRSGRLSIDCAGSIAVRAGADAVRRSDRSRRELASGISAVSRATEGSRTDEARALRPLVHIESRDRLRVSAVASRELRVTRAIVSASRDLPRCFIAGMVDERPDLTCRVDACCEPSPGRFCSARRCRGSRQEAADSARPLPAAPSPFAPVLRVSQAWVADRPPRLHVKAMVSRYGALGLANHSVIGLGHAVSRESINRMQASGGANATLPFQPSSFMPASVE